MNQPLPIDPTEVLQHRQVRALQLATELGLLTYLAPVRMRVQESVDQARQLLSQPGRRGGSIVLPTDDGDYYLVYVPSKGGPNAVMIPDREVLPFVFALAVAAGRDTAEKVLYRKDLLPHV